jgi:hypothetical protein
VFRLVLPRRSFYRGAKSINSPALTRRCEREPNLLVKLTPSRHQNMCLERSAVAAGGGAGRGRGGELCQYVYVFEFL